MSFTIPFFKRKSEQGVGRSGKFVSPTSVPSSAPKLQTNGEIISEESDKIYPFRNSSSSKQLTTKSPYIYIEYLGSSGAESEAPSFDKCFETEVPARSSQLSKTLKQVLHDKDALPYFIQYMDSIGNANLVKFWLDADTFKATSITKIHSDSIPCRSLVLHKQESDGAVASYDASRGALSSDTLRNIGKDNLNSLFVSSSCDVTSLDKKIHLGSVTAHGHGRFSQNLLSSSPTSLPKTTCESASLTRSRELQATNYQNDIPDAIPQSLTETKACDISGGQDRDGTPQSVGDSLEAGVKKSSSSNISDPLDAPASGETTTKECELTSQKNVQKSIENDAIVIFSKYLSPDCSQPIGINDELRAQTIRRICHEDGVVDPCCFDDCQQYVFGLMENQYYLEFLQSIYYIKHEIDILSQLQLVDILYNDTALSYFTEFMEEEKVMALLQCFLDLDNFQRHLLSQGDSYDGNEAQSDAMIIYDKYISMQATQPVRFDDRVRLEVETNICRESGPLPECFRLPCHLVLKYMEQAYFPLFMKSAMYTKYVTDLLNTSHLMQDSVEYRRKRTGSDASSEKSAGSQSTGNEISKNTYLARDTSGQHMAKALNKFSDNMQIDGSLFNPDSLWHRPNAGRMKFGKVTELGQFVSDFDPDPDHDKKKLTPFFSVTKRREREKSEEDMAWQEAQKIINDVMSAAGSDSLQSDLDVPDKTS